MASGVYLYLLLREGLSTARLEVVGSGLEPF